MAFPDMLVVWSDIIAQTTWHLARSKERLNKARRKVNSEVGRFVVMGAWLSGI